MIAWRAAAFFSAMRFCMSTMPSLVSGNTSFMADTIDFELDRSGRYVPAVVSGTYSFIDEIITAFSAVPHGDEGNGPANQRQPELKGQGQPENPGGKGIAGLGQGVGVAHHQSMCG